MGADGSIVDWERLRADAREGARRTFTQVIKAHPDERFYGFAFYAYCLGSWLRGAANTEEALLRTAQRYARENPKSYSDATTLRLCVPDWEYVNIGWDAFEAVHQTVDQHPMLYDSPTFTQRIFEAYCRGLEDLDGEGFFRQCGPREDLVLFIHHGDMSDEEMLRFIERLNPPAAVERCRPFLNLPAS